MMFFDCSMNMRNNFACLHPFVFFQCCIGRFHSHSFKHDVAVCQAYSNTPISWPLIISMSGGISYISSIAAVGVVNITPISHYT